MKRTGLKALVAVLAIITSVVAALALEDGARTVEIVGFGGAAFAAGVAFATLVSGIRRGGGR